MLLDLEVLAEIVSSPAGPKTMRGSPTKPEVKLVKGMNIYFTKFMFNLLKIFASDQQLLDDRGSYIIRLVHTHHDSLKVPIPIRSLSPLPNFFFKHIVILVPVVESYLKGFMCMNWHVQTQCSLGKLGEKPSDHRGI